jgi:hypothetical protein
MNTARRLYLGEAILWLLFYLPLCYLTFTERADASRAIFAVGALFAFMFSMANVLRFYAAKGFESKKEASNV